MSEPSIVELGTAFSAGRDGMERMLVDLVAQQVQQKIMPAIIRQVAAATGRPPTVNVPPAQVRVEAPKVEVAPNIDVTVPDIEIPEVHVAVEMPGLMELCSKIDALLALETKPVIKTVERDRDGNIVRVTERRGG